MSKRKYVVCSPGKVDAILLLEILLDKDTAAYFRNLVDGVLHEVGKQQLSVSVRAKEYTNLLRKILWLGMEPCFGWIR